MDRDHFLNVVHDKPLAVSPAGPISQSDFRDRILSYQHSLEQAAPGVWGVYLDDVIEFGSAVFALHASGRKIVVLPNAQPDFLKALEPALQGWILDEAVESALPCISPETRASIDHSDAALDLSLESMTLSFFTSGTTGAGKEVKKSWEQLCAEVNELELLWGERADSATFLSSVTHQHIYGFLFHFLWPLLQGRPIWAESLVFPDRLQSALVAVEKAVLVSCPAHLQRMVDLIDLEILNAKCFTIFSSGGLLETHHAHRIDSAWREPPIEVFGSTETGGVAHRQQVASHKNVPWARFPSVEVRVKNTLQVRSPFVGLNEVLEEGGWCAMGDQAEILESGQFRTLGRKDRIVKIEQKRVSLNDVEQRLLGHPDVRACRVVLLPAEGVYQRNLLGALMVMNEPCQVGRESELKRLLKKFLSGYFEPVTLPRRWVIAEALPENAAGKCTEADVLARFEKKSPKPRTWLPEILEEECSESEVNLQCRVPESLCFFEGHFDEFPIVAGVVQMHWAMHFAKAKFKVSPGTDEMKRVKFQHILLPRDEFSLHIKYEAEKREVAFQLCGAEKEFSSGRIVTGT